MHTWALFSCSSLITLTAYNVTNPPSTLPIGPEPEPDPGSTSADDTKFKLEASGDRQAEYKATVALPPLPNQPQLSKLDVPALANPAVNRSSYDSSRYPVAEVDLVGLLRQKQTSVPSTSRAIAYRTESLPPLPSSLPAPLPPPPSAQPLVMDEALQTAESANLPQPETASSGPTFANGNQSEAVPMATPTTTSPEPSEPTPELVASVPNASSPSRPAQLVTATDGSSGDLFAALPRRSVPVRVAVEDVPPVERLADVERPTTTMARAVPDENLENLSEASPSQSPSATASMKITVVRQQLIDNYCQRSRSETSSERTLAVCDDKADKLAQTTQDTEAVRQSNADKETATALAKLEVDASKTGDSATTDAIAQ